MKKYDSYKDSGVEWIGNIPSNWEAKRIKLFSPVKRGASPRPIDDPKYFDENGEYAWVRIADVTASDRYLLNTTQRLSELGASLSVKRHEGDFFLSIAGSVGKPMITKIKCCIHDGFVYFPSLSINPEFLYYIFQTGLPYLGLGKLGTQLNLNTETVGNIFIPIPTDDEIEVITKYLDNKTTQIDHLIAKKGQFIQLLEEERVAVINQAVTKGLDPNVSMKDSGIEMLGEIPEHWEIAKIKRLSTLISKGTTPSTVGKEVSDNGEIRYLKSENIVDNQLLKTPEFYIDNETNQILKRSMLELNDVLIVIAGASIGKVAILTDDFCPSNTNQAVSFIRLKNPNSSCFVWYWLQSSYIKERISLDATQSAQPNLSMESIGNFYIPKISIEEEQDIITFLTQKTKDIDVIISKTKHEIELLKEYKMALISEVVTGKVDVRNEKLN
ncbi:restriction endonuclease subunit S [Flavobacterium ammonificans]|uniref:restriction endonuclease subunit S n=1 Tax=Flavobacterium ammonificans TaxID=1751056 RepID=UPI001E428F3B|nr:restriction endonuclease subunit S [Flavobacterium ammonificans]BDB56559.1 restriction modification system DNA specificity domain-containing protein [Flavobacterium ammonificans]